MQRGAGYGAEKQVEGGAARRLFWQGALLWRCKFKATKQVEDNNSEADSVSTDDTDSVSFTEESVAVESDSVDDAGHCVNTAVV